MQGLAAAVFQEKAKPRRGFTFRRTKVLEAAQRLAATMASWRRLPESGGGRYGSLRADATSCWRGCLASFGYKRNDLSTAAVGNVPRRLLEGLVSAGFAGLAKK